MARSPYVPDPAELQGIARPWVAKPSAIPEVLRQPPPGKTFQSEEQKLIERLTAPTPSKAPGTVRRCSSNRFESVNDMVDPSSSLVFDCGLAPPSQTPSLVEMTPVAAPATPPCVRQVLPEPDKERFSCIIRYTTVACTYIYIYAYTYILYIYINMQYIYICIYINIIYIHIYIYKHAIYIIYI